LLLLPPRYTRSTDSLWVVDLMPWQKFWGLGTADVRINRAQRKGHTLKHLAAAMAGY